MPTFISFSRARGPIRLSDDEEKLPVANDSAHQGQKDRLERSPRRAISLAILATLAAGSYIWTSSLNHTIAGAGDIADEDQPEWIGKFKYHQQGAFQGVDWHECVDDRIQELPKEIRNRFSCAVVSTPLDYFDNSVGNASIAVVQFATNVAKSERLGSLLTNPGGPGGSGYDQVIRTGPSLSFLTGRRYDVIGFDPRGIGRTRPTFRCFATAVEEYSYTRSIEGLMEGQVPIFPPLNLSTPENLAQLRRQCAQSESADSTTASVCEAFDQRGGGERAGKYMSTAHVVRDINLLSTLLDGPESPIRFWGFSYGTTVATYLVSMFPDRVGQVAIDGVMAVKQWYTNPHDRQTGRYALKGMEESWEEFLRSCAKASDRCALAEGKLSAEEIGAKVDTLLDQLYYHPMPVPEAKTPSTLTSKRVIQFMFRGLYKPRGWAEFAAGLQSAIEGNGTAILNAQYVAPVTDPKLKGTSAWAGNQVGVSDAPPLDPLTQHERTDRLYEQILEDHQSYTRHFAGSLPESTWSWRIRASERFNGPIGGKLSFPALIIGNTFDNICPLENAQILRKQIKDSRLVQQDTAGHCSVAVTSLCTAKVIREYFDEGKLPKDGLICPPSEEPFEAPKFWSGDNQMVAEALHAVSLAL